jgi:hypothetical protein
MEDLLYTYGKVGKARESQVAADALGERSVCTDSGCSTCVWAGAGLSDELWKYSESVGTLQRRVDEQGSGDADPLTYVWQAEVTNATWELVTPAGGVKPCSRAGHAMVAVGDVLWMHGGFVRFCTNEEAEGTNEEAEGTNEEAEGTNEEAEGTNEEAEGSNAGRNEGESGQVSGMR